MELRRFIFPLVCILISAVMLPVVSLAATYNDVDSFEELRAAFIGHADPDPGPAVINITGNFDVNMTPDKWYHLPAGSTINGNGHTLNLINLNNNGNGQYIFRSKGNCTIKDITFDATNLIAGTRVAALSDGDTLKNVTIKGASKLAYGMSVGGSAAVTVTNCDFSGVSQGIYTSENPVLNITNSTFEDCGYAVILRGDGSVFSNNTVLDSKVNARGTNAVLTNNTFNGESRIKFYTEDSAKDFSGNKINDESYIDVEAAAKNTDVSKNIFENIDTALKDRELSQASKNAAKEAQIARNQPDAAGKAAALPKTGDESNIALWIALMVISTVAGMALVRKSRFN